MQRLWCNDQLAALTLGDSTKTSTLQVETWALTVDQWTSEELMQVGSRLWTKQKPSQISRLRVGCDLWFDLRLLEGPAGNTTC